MGEGAFLVTSARAALVAQMLASVEESICALQWCDAVAARYPQAKRHLAAELNEIDHAKIQLALCERLSVPHVARPQDLRRRSPRRGAISRASTRAMNTTTRDCTSGRQLQRRRVFQGAPVLAPTNVR